MEEQISIFEMLGEPATPLIPFEEQKKDRRGWIIEISGIFLKKNGFAEDAIGVCTRPVIFEKDSEKDKYGRMWQQAKTTHGPHSSWVSRGKEIYAARPTWKECQEYVRKRYSLPEKVIYYERDGNFNPTYEYEEGYRK